MFVGRLILKKYWGFTVHKIKCAEAVAQRYSLEKVFFNISEAAIGGVL